MEDGVERPPLHVFHEKEDELRRFFEAEHRGDVAVPQCGRNARLAPKPLHPRLSLQHGRGQHLDRDLAVERDVVGQVDEPHAAASEHAPDLVLPECDLLQIGEQLCLDSLRNGRTTSAAITVPGEHGRAAGGTCAHRRGAGGGWLWLVAHRAREVTERAVSGRIW